MHRDLFITIDFPPSSGGVARYYAALLSALGNRSITVLAPAGTKDDPRLPETIHLVRKRLFGPTWVWPRWLPMLWHAVHLVRKERPVLLHVGQVLPVGSVALFVQRFFKIPFLVYTHGLDVLLASRSARKRSLTRTILLHAALIVCNSDATKQLVSQLGVPADRMLVVRPGCTLVGVMPDSNRTETIRQRYALAGKAVILTVARLVERKGIQTALQAFARIAQQYPNAVYVVVGDGPKRADLDALAAKLGLGNRVRWVGKAPEEDLPSWYDLCSLFLLVPNEVQGTDLEGFGIVYLEAAAFGKAVIASRTGGVPEAVVDKRTGLLVPPEDVAATTAALNELLLHPEHALHLGAEGRRRVEQEGTWEQRVRPLRQWLETRPSEPQT